MADAASKKGKSDITRCIQIEENTGSNPKMAPKLVLKCTKCGGYILAAQAQKTKNCPYCGTNVNLQKAQQVAAAKDAIEASEIIKHLKAEKGFNHKP